MENDEGSLQPTDENLKVASAFIRGLSRPDRADGKRQEKVLATLRVHRDTYSSVLGTLIQPALQYNMSGLKEHFRIANAYKRRMVSIGPVATADGICENQFHLRDTLPFATTWRTEPGCKKAIETRTRLFYAENGEARPVHDDEVDQESFRDSLLRHALQNDEWALCAALKQHSFSAGAILAVAKLEQWTWEDAVRFILASPHMLTMLLQSPQPLLHSLGPASTSPAATGGAMAAAALSRAASSQACSVACDDASAPSRPVSRASEVPPAAVQSADPCTAQSLPVDAVSKHHRGSGASDPQDHTGQHDAEDSANASDHLPCLLKLCLGLSSAASASQQQAEVKGLGGAGMRHCVVCPSDAAGGPLKASISHEPASSGWDSKSGEEEDTAVMDDIVAAFCRRCQDFNCERHGDIFQHTDNAEVKADTVIGHADGEPSKEFESHARQWSTPCGSGCHTLPLEVTASSQASAKFTAVETQALDTWRECMGPNACLLAPLVHGRQCREVHAWLTRQGLLESTDGGEDDKDRDPLDFLSACNLNAPTRRKRKRLVASAPVGQTANGLRRNAPAFLSRRRHNPQEPWPEYTPCDCDPTKGCTGSCPCAASKNYCEKYCGCGGACSNVHRGCKCNGSCNTNTCPCYDDARECDPQKCLSCRATAHGLVQQGDRVCNNMNLRLGTKRTLAMGISGIAGWGLFAMEDIARGDFIGEYVGELLSQGECERRGQVYDIINSSYLFQLNTEWAIDARKAGSKLRFANHQVDTNTYARVMMVSGDHHVGMYAKTDMKAGDELKYDYGYHTGEGYCPRWGDISHRPAKQSSDSGTRPNPESE